MPAYITLPLLVEQEAAWPAQYNYLPPPLRCFIGGQEAKPNHRLGFPDGQLLLRLLQTSGDLLPNERCSYTNGLLPRHGAVHHC